MSFLTSRQLGSGDSCRCIFKIHMLNVRVCISVSPLFFFFLTLPCIALLSMPPLFVLIGDIHIHESATHHQQSPAGQILSSALCSI